MTNRIIDAPNPQCIGLRFPDFASRPGPEITGDGWIIAAEFAEQEKMAEYGYCNEPGCSCAGSMTYWGTGVTLRRAPNGIQKREYLWDQEARKNIETWPYVVRV